MLVKALLHLPALEQGGPAQAAMFMAASQADQPDIVRWTVEKGEPQATPHG
jgi:hypothetical protein